MADVLDRRYVGTTKGAALPAQPTRLIGREGDAQRLQQALRDPATRLLTLLGPPGVGKTRLALHVAPAIACDFPDGAFVVDLAALDEPDQALGALEDVLAVAPDPDEAPLARLCRQLADRKVLVILDHGEHLLALTPALATLLATCPRLTLLVVSRVALRLRWERKLRLAPLPTPDPATDPALERLAAVPAVTLYVERTQAVRPDFQLTAANAASVARLCVRLDGLPLALELAAAQGAALTPGDLLALLERQPNALAGNWIDLPARQQSLRSTLRWSYDLLSPAEQTLFSRLGAFAGGGTVEAIQAVCGQEGDPANLDLALLEGLTSLLDQSLLQRQETPDGAVRFRLLETVRHYALERLAERGELSDLRGRHAAWYLTLAERAEDACQSSRHGAWLDRLERELDNFRAARTWWEGEDRDPERSLRLAAALYVFWTYRGYLAEGRRWLEAALGAAEDGTVGEDVRADALYAAGRVAEHQGDFPAAYTFLADSIGRYRRLDRRARLAQALAWCASIAPPTSGVDPATLLEESLAIYRGLDDRGGISKVLNFLGELARLRGDYERAAAYYEESLAICEALDLGMAVAVVRHNLGYIAQHLGQQDRAAALFADCLARYQAFGDQRLLAVGVAALAAVAASDQPERATRVFAAAEAHLEAMGAVMQPADRAEHERNVGAVRARLDESRFRAAWTAGRAMTIEEALAELEESRPREESPAPTVPLPAVLHAPELTPREQEVAALVARGLTNRQIALRLVISERTADSHVGNILGKLGFASRSQVAAWAVEQGLRALPAGGPRPSPGG